MFFRIFWSDSQVADGRLLAHVSSLECAHCNHSPRGATIFGEATKLLLMVLSTALLVETEQGTCGAFVALTTVSCGASWIPMAGLQEREKTFGEVEPGRTQILL